MFMTILLFYSVRPHGDTESLNAFVLWWKTKRIRKTYKYSRCGRPENASSLTVVRELEFKSLWGRIKWTLMDACCLHDPPFCVWQMPTDMMVIVKVTLGQNRPIKDPFFFTPSNVNSRVGRVIMSPYFIHHSNQAAVFSATQKSKLQRRIFVCKGQSACESSQTEENLWGSTFTTRCT